MERKEPVDLCSYVNNQKMPESIIFNKKRYITVKVDKENTKLFRQVLLKVVRGLSIPWKHLAPCQTVSFLLAVNQENINW